MQESLIVTVLQDFLDFLKLFPFYSHVNYIAWYIFAPGIFGIHTFFNKFFN